MKILIKTTKDSINYEIIEVEDVSNDEISRAIAFLELVKRELLDKYGFDYEVLEK